MKLLTQDYWTQLPWCLWSSRSQELAHFSALLVDGLTLDICWMWKAGIWHYAKDSNFKNIVIPLYNSLFGLQIFFSFNCKQMKGLLVNNMLLIINLTVLYTAWQKDCFLPLCTIKKDQTAVSDVVCICLVNSILCDNEPPSLSMLCPTSSHHCPMLGKREEKQRCSHFSACSLD